MLIGAYSILVIILGLLNHYNYKILFYMTLGIIGVIYVFSPKILNDFLLFQYSKYIRLIFGILLIIIAIKEKIL